MKSTTTLRAPQATIIILAVDKCLEIQSTMNNPRKVKKSQWTAKARGQTIVTGMRKEIPGRTMIILDTTECKRMTGARRIIAGARTTTNTVRAARTGVDKVLGAGTRQMEAIVNSTGETGAIRGPTMTTIAGIHKWTTWTLIGWFHQINDGC